MTAILYTLAAVALALVVIAATTATTALHRAEARRVWRATLHRIDSERQHR